MKRKLLSLLMLLIATMAAKADGTYIVMGSDEDIFGAYFNDELSWDDDDENPYDNPNIMTWNSGEECYEKTYTVDKEYEDIEIQVSENEGENYNYYPSYDLYYRFNLTDAGTFTVRFYPATGKVTVEGDNVEIPISSIYLGGNGATFEDDVWMAGLDWDPETAELTETSSGSGVYTITFDEVPAGEEYQFKFYLDGEELHTFGGDFVASGTVTTAVYDGDAITFDLSHLSDVTISIDMRNFNSSTKEGAKFTVTFTTLHEHVFANEWRSDQTYHWHACVAEGHSDDCLAEDDAEYEEHDYGETGDARFTCTVCGYVDAELRDYYFELDNGYSEIYLGGNGEDFDDEVWMDGKNWNPKTDQLWDDNGVYETYFNNVPAGEGYQFKFYLVGDELHTLGGTFDDFDTETDAVYGGDAITFDLNHLSNVTITIDMSEYSLSTKEGAKFKVTTTSVHEHSFATGWTFDEDGHWHACTDEGNSDDCLEEVGAAWGEHTYDGTGDARFTCTVCGYVDEDRRVYYITLSETTDNTATIADYADKHADVTLTRTLKAGGWNTFCAPFDISKEMLASKGITKVKKLYDSSYDETSDLLTLYFTDDDMIGYGEPYLVWVDNDVVNPVFEYVEVKTGEYPHTTDYVDFIPVMNKPKALTGGNKSVLFVKNGNALTYPLENINIYSFRAYFELKDDYSVKAHAFNMDFDGIATDIMKLENGELKTDNGATYTLDGRRVNGQPNRKGIYIVNGKKVIK